MNKYKLMSYAFLVVFFLLSTIQTLLDIQINFGTDLVLITYIASLIASIVPVGVIIFLTNYIRNKTKYSNLFVVSDVKSVIKTMFYVTLLAVFMLWSIIFVSVILVIYNQQINFTIFINFILIRAIYTIIYSFIISLFFNSISKPGFKVEKNEL